MRRNAHIASLIILCVLGSGAQWDLLQFFAWGRMIVEHSQTMSLSAAVEKTFDGEMCGICRMVAAAKKQEQRQSGTPEVKIESKLLLFSQTSAPIVIVAPLLDFGRPINSRFSSQVRLSPPVPPPRQAVA